MLLEICVDNFASARSAIRGGADRIELCSALDVGGLTPSVALLKMIRRLDSKIAINCLIRPRAGDFCFEEDEIIQMIEEIEILKANGSSGFVIGCLNPDRTIDVLTTRRLVQAAGTKCTFHRAFDVAVIEDFTNILQTLADIGCDTLLTSGQASTARFGQPLLIKIQNIIIKNSIPIVLLIGGGVNRELITQFINNSSIRHFHGSFSSKDSFENDIFSSLGLKYRSNEEVISACTLENKHK